MGDASLIHGKKMTYIDKLERNFGRFAIPNLTLVLVASQSLCFILKMARPEFVRDLFLIPSLVFKGEVWRIVTFMIVPPEGHPFLVIIALYIFYFMGTSLEEAWGAFRYNLYIFVAFITTIAATLAGPVLMASNLYIEGSVFLAFAFLYPNFEFLLFFILPVKVKYLAWFTWFLYGLQLLGGSTSDRVLILASLSNYALFFGPEIKEIMESKKRKREYEAKQSELKSRTLHQCGVCNLTEKSDRNMEFRVCSKCSQGQEYCATHINDHEHS